FDLGPTWYWPEFQPRMDRLIRELDLESFPQFDTGDMLVERSLDEPPLRIPDSGNVPIAMRLKGGMGALVDALHRRLDATRILVGQAVHQLRCAKAQVELEGHGAHGEIVRRRVEHVLLAVPPRLAEQTITFAPALPQTLARQWCGTATWMAPHAKY